MPEIAEALPDLSRVPDQIKMLLEESVVPSPHSIDLSRSPASDYLYRQVRKTPHVAELYHENSKLNPHSTLQPIDDPEVFEQIRHWFFSTGYAMDTDAYLIEETPDLRVELADLPENLAGLLRPFSEPSPLTNLLYSSDLLLLHGDLLTRMFPEAPYLWTERMMAEQERHFLGTKFGMPPEAWQGTVGVLFLVACPWRYMLLHGPRGYRHTLLDIGRLLAYFEDQAPVHGLDLIVQQNFHDSVVDRFILADGLERSTYAVLILRTPEESPAPEDA